MQIRTISFAGGFVTRHVAFVSGLSKHWQSFRPKSECVYRATERNIQFQLSCGQGLQQTNHTGEQSRLFFLHKRHLSHCALFMNALGKLLLCFQRTKVRCVSCYPGEPDAERIPGHFCFCRGSGCHAGSGE